MSNRKQIVSVVAFLVTTFLIFSCQEEKINKNYKYQLIDAGQVQFPIDTKTPLVSSSIKYFENDDVEYLFFLNNITNSIQRFAFSNPNETITIELDKNGPNGVGLIDGFDVQSIDTLIVNSPSSYKVSLISQIYTSPIIKSFKTLKRNNKIEYTPFANNSNRLILHEKNIFIPIVPYCDPKSEDCFNYGNSELALNLNDQSLNTFNVYSEIYSENWSGRYLRYSTDYNLETNTMFYSLPAEPRIISKDLTTGETSYHNGASTLFEEIRPYDDQGRLTDKEHYINEPHYGQILYDKYRKLYYRFAYRPDYRGIKNNDHRVETKDPSIIVFDENFKLLTELDLPIYEYITPMAFVSKNGLFISQPLIIDKENEIIEEDVLRFVLFKLKDNNATN